MSQVEFKDEEVRKYLNDVIKKINKVKKAERAYVGLLSAIVFRDLMDHFSKEESRTGKWPELKSKSYAAWKRKKGYEGLLKNTGKLRSGLAPIEQNRYTKTGEGIAWVNLVNYSGKHEYGQGVRKRSFMWLSDKALDEMGNQTLQFLMDERFS